MDTQDVDQPEDKIPTVFLLKFSPYNERKKLLLYNGSKKSDSGIQVIPGDVFWFLHAW